MIVYRLKVEPAEYDSDGEDHDEWFGSLRAARERRRELVTEDPALEEHRTGQDFAISRVTVADMPRRKLVLALLNRTGYRAGEEVEVVKAYAPRR